MPGSEPFEAWLDRALPAAVQSELGPSPRAWQATYRRPPAGGAHGRGAGRPVAVAVAVAVANVLPRRAGRTRGARAEPEPRRRRSSSAGEPPAGGLPVVGPEPI